MAWPNAFDRSGSKLYSSGKRFFPAPGPDEKLKRALRQMRAPVTNLGACAAFYRSHHPADNLQKSYQSGLSQSLPGAEAEGAKAEYPFVRPTMTRPPPVNV